MTEKWAECPRCRVTMVVEGGVCPRCDPYGVPTGYVPRKNLVNLPDGDREVRGTVDLELLKLGIKVIQTPSIEDEAWIRQKQSEMREAIELTALGPRSTCPGCGVPEPEFHKPGCLQQVIDDYLLMKRKARAWDKVMQCSAGDPAAQLDGAHFASWLDAVWESVHPAQTGD